jgi:hypothetical protein
MSQALHRRAFAALGSAGTKDRGDDADVAGCRPAPDGAMLALSRYRSRATFGRFDRPRRKDVIGLAPITPRLLPCSHQRH